MKSTRCNDCNFGLFSRYETHLCVCENTTRNGYKEFLLIRELFSTLQCKSLLAKLFEDYIQYANRLGAIALEYENILSLLSLKLFFQVHGLVNQQALLKNYMLIAD